MGACRTDFSNFSQQNDIILAWYIKHHPHNQSPILCLNTLLLHGQLLLPIYQWTPFCVHIFVWAAGKGVVFKQAPLGCGITISKSLTSKNIVKRYKKIDKLFRFWRHALPISRKNCRRQSLATRFMLSSLEPIKCMPFSRESVPKFGTLFLIRFKYLNVRPFVKK